MTGRSIYYDGFIAEQEGYREALCTVGNGYVATRGALAESSADGVHYPGTYIAGVFNRLDSEISGRVVENESLVNLPNWLVLEVRAEGGEWFGVGTSTVVEHHVELEMRRAVLARRSTLRDGHGRTVRITQHRFASMRDQHVLAMATTITVDGWEGRLEVRSAIDGTVRNQGVARYRPLPDQHLVPIVGGADSDEVVHLLVETNQSHVRIAEAARTRLTRNGEPSTERPELIERPGYVAQHFSVDVHDGDVIAVEKVVALFTSRDGGISEPLSAARTVATDAPPFDRLLRRHETSWNHLWRRMRIDIGADGEVERLLHLHQFHLLQTVSNNSIGHDVGVPARGLHGEAYRGHIFWDELFVFPFLSLRFPQLTRSLLLYRHRRMDQARRAATAAGLRGAMFPWQSGSDGSEQTQTMHLNPVSQRWLPDRSHRQRHVNAAIVVNIWQYYEATCDLEFLRFFGAEMVLEIARFWASVATLDEGLGRYEIKGVMGPDEYHDGYPDRSEPGLDNNAYTNLMAVWCLDRAFDVMDALPEVTVRDLRESLELGDDELERWRDITRRMRVCFHDGIISQFEGFHELEELDWERYHATYGSGERLDRNLEAEGDTPNRYQAIKQADVLMLFYVLSADELAELLEQLGYRYDADLIPRNVAYYTARTTNGSTLSRVVEAWVTARLDRARSWQFFDAALRSDYQDSQHGTTAEGIHLGAMAGTIDLIQRCYTGLETRNGVLRLNPVVPVELGTLSYDVRYRGHVVKIDLSAARLHLRLEVDRSTEHITVVVRGERFLLGPGDSVDIELG